MDKNFNKLLKGYKQFRGKYVHGNKSIMRFLSQNGQQPEVMVIACCDSRVDPALILQCDPGDLFVVRNIANIVPPYEKDEGYHGTSAALEFGICFLKVKHLVILGHSQCGGIQALVKGQDNFPNDFISHWVASIDKSKLDHTCIDSCAQQAINQSYGNCLTFPWIQEKVTNGELQIHQWFFDIHAGMIMSYCESTRQYMALEVNHT